MSTAFSIVITGPDSAWRISFQHQPEHRVWIEGKLPTFEEWIDAVALVPNISLPLARALYTAAAHAFQKQRSGEVTEVERDEAVRAAADRLVEVTKERDAARADRESMHKDYLRVAGELSVAQRERDAAQAEVKRLKDKLNTDSQHFEIQCLKAERDAFREKLDKALGPDKDQEAFVSAIAKERDEARAELEKCRRVVQCPPLVDGQTLSAYLEQWATRCSQETEIGKLRALADMRLRSYAEMEVERDKYKNELERHIRLLFECVNERDDYKKRKDDAYLERNRVVAAFARLITAMGWPVAVTRTAIEGWSEDWHGCIFIGTPYGQVSWHFHDSHAHLFKDLPHGPATWDGHSTPEKYARLEKLVASTFAVPVRPIKVKLPDVHDSCREGWAPAIEACAAAIRAAGGEVEG